MNIIPRLIILAASMIAALLPTSIAIAMLTRTADQFLTDMDQRQAVTMAAVRLERAVIDAETAQRGFLLSGTEVYESEYRAAMGRAADALGELREASRSAPEFLSQAQGVIRPAEAEMKLLNRMYTAGPERAVAIVRNEQGRFEAQAMREAVHDLEAAQHRRNGEGARYVYRMLAAGRWLAIGGAVLGIVLVLFTFAILGRYLRNSLSSILTAMRQADEAGIPADVAARLSGEFRELGDTYNQVCARMRIEIAHRDEAEGRIADLLDRSGAQLAHRKRAGEILGRISNRLPACLDQQELVALATRFIPQLFDIRGGALYFLNNSSTVLTRVASWGDCVSSLAEFRPSKCWALRRGQQHMVDDIGADVTCGHVSCDDLDGYVCMPLIAQGETVGLLYLESSGNEATRGNDEELEDMRVLCENLALALVNLRLRESLRHQSLRDPLTGLHNRRYLEETIELEFAKSRRNASPVSVVMADVDHFKHLNDSFGHDAGDLVLRRIATALGANIRKGDVACRYGGEEFVILLPGLGHDEAVERAELLRDVVRTLQIRSADTEVGQVTASFGVATFMGGEEDPAAVIREADQALYEAKSAGRDQVRSQKRLRIADHSANIA